MSIRLLIFVQEVTFADALATRLEAEPDLDVVAALYLRSSSRQLFAGSPADVFLLDGDLPDDAAFRLFEELARPGDLPRTVFLSHTSDPRRITRAIAAGAVGWVRKDESLDRLIEVIHGVAGGETCLPTRATGPVLRFLMQESNTEQDNDGLLTSALTPREREVLACLAEGTNRRALAEHLNMSPNTARTHLQNLMSKLGVHSALEAVALMRSDLNDQLSQRHFTW
ncbi:MAG TPA: response regulator transcription factor [Streptosporangiaceae bacterium]